MNLNSKLRSDSVFAQLNNEQIEVLKDWLFEEKLGYKEVLEKAKAEWNVKTSLTSLGRFYRRLALQRSEERRLETVALCLEGLAAKNDGTLQAGLLALANQCAIEFLVEQPKSIREFATLLRALTSAGVFEMKHIEFHETREREKLDALENERNAAEAREKAAREKEKLEKVFKENNARNNARYQKGLATRKANLAKKAAAEEAAKTKVLLGVNKPAEATSPRPSPPEAERVTDRLVRTSENLGTVAVSKPQAEIGGQPSAFAEAMADKKGCTPNSPAVDQQELPENGTRNGALEGFDGLVEGEDFTINWAGNPEKPLKTH